jgi:hypothetical protein
VQNRASPFLAFGVHSLIRIGDKGQQVGSYNGTKRTTSISEVGWGKVVGLGSTRVDCRTKLEGVAFPGVLPVNGSWLYSVEYTQTKTLCERVSLLRPRPKMLRPLLRP